MKTLLARMSLEWIGCELWYIHFQSFRFLMIFGETRKIGLQHVFFLKICESVNENVDRMATVFWRG